MHSMLDAYLRFTDSCIPPLKAQGPSRTCNESNEEEEEAPEHASWRFFCFFVTLEATRAPVHTALHLEGKGIQTPMARGRSICAAARPLPGAALCAQEVAAEILPNIDVFHCYLS